MSITSTVPNEILSFRGPEDNKGLMYIIFDKPRTREIYFKTYNSFHLLNLPYVYYIIHLYNDKFCDLSIYLSNRKPRSLSDRCLTRFDFLNCCEGEACLGNKAKSFLAKKSIDDIIRLIPRLFWESTFNDLYGIPCDLPLRNKISKKELLNSCVNYSFESINDIKDEYLSNM